MNKCRVILVRHGETNWNKEGRYQGQIDTELSERGIEQGKALALALKDIHIDEFYASHLKRARDTAGFCAQYHGKDVKVDERLQEIAHGTWEGRLASDVELESPELLKAWRQTPDKVLMPEGEDLQMLNQRSMRALEDIASSNVGKTVLVAAHDATNKVLICSIMQAPLSSFWQVKQDNTCINVIEYENGVWRLVLLNSTLHMGYLYSGIEQKGL